MAGTPVAGDAHRLGSQAGLYARLEQAMNERRARGLERTLQARPEHDGVLDLANNDYLRLSQHPAVKAAAMAATERWGASSSASPLVTGYTTAHAQLLETLQAWCGFSRGLLWNTGYAANSAVLGCLPRKGDLVLADRLIHNSMVNGLLTSGARIQRFRHLDLEHLRELLEKNAAPDRVIFVVSETVYSMDGDYPDLRAMADLKARYGFTWILDEAHALGWYGQSGSGLVEQAGVVDAVDVLVGTLGKGLGSMGAFTLFHDELFQRYLINHAGEFIYSTYLPPACAAAANAAVTVLRDQPGRCEKLHAMSHRFRRMLRQDLAASNASAVMEKQLQAETESGALAAANVPVDCRLRVPDGDAPIVPVRTDDPVAVAARLREQGIRVGAIRPPTVPVGEGRLRISLNALLSLEDLKRVAAAVNALCV